MPGGNLAQLKAALDTVQQAVLSPQVIRAAGAGKAFQSVAQSCAITVQDGSDYLRNILTISATAQGVAIAMIAAGNPNGATLLSQAQSIVPTATTQFSAIGTAAAGVITAFPSS